VIAAIQRAIQLQSQYNIRVINLSLGRPVFESYLDDPLCQAVQQAWNAGIVVVVAAGNDGRNNTYGNLGYGTINAPGNSPYVITVGAMNTVQTLSSSDDKMTSYSSKGPTLFDSVVKPDIVAPGNQIVSIEAGGSQLVSSYPNNRVAQCLYQTSTNLGASSQYFQLSGTSLAAPMVSGAVALLLQQDPTLTPDQVKARLMLTATKLPQVNTVSVDPSTGIQYVSENDVLTVGAGYLNVAAALASTVKATLPATSPSVNYDPVANQVTMLTGSGLLWGSDPLWGTDAIWGAAAVSRKGAIWGTGTLTGTAAVARKGAIWGTSTDENDALTVAIAGDN